MRVHVDDRRSFLGDLFDIPDGDVNVAYLHHGSICGWHRHQRQDDQLFCVSGTVKVGITKGPAPHNTVKWEVLTDRNPRVLGIYRGMYHGYMAIGGPAILVGYNNQKYDPTDEERMGVLEMGHFWDTVPR